jgi:hypothetical protein
MKLLERAYAPTPKFFKLLRAIGLTIAALGGSLIAAPVALPIIVTSIAGYMTLAGGLLSAVSQLTITDEKPDASQ